MWIFLDLLLLMLLPLAWSAQWAKQGVAPQASHQKGLTPLVEVGDGVGNVLPDDDVLCRSLFSEQVTFFFHHTNTHPTHTPHTPHSPLNVPVLLLLLSPLLLLLLLLLHLYLLPRNTSSSSLSSSSAPPPNI
jgi:hypothetical protein